MFFPGGFGEFFEDSIEINDHGVDGENEVGGFFFIGRASLEFLGPEGVVL